MYAFFLLCLLLLQCDAANCKSLRWTFNTSMENPYNWNVGRLPCRNDRVTFPTRAPAVYVQSNQFLLELVLPNDGEFVLAEGASLSFPETPDGSCTGQDIVFTGATPKSWFDPNHWCVTSDDASGGCLKNQLELLDTEKIPCQSDNVLFPTGVGYFVDLESGMNIRVGTLKVLNNQMNTESFRSYLDSEDGKKVFVRQNSSSAAATTLTVTGNSECRDSTGCVCGNRLIQQRVCALQKCLHVTCHSFVPNGHCCQLCGAMLTMDHGAGFKIQNLRNLITKTFQNLNVDPNNITVIVSKLDNDQIQAVLSSTGNEEGAISVAKRLKDSLDTDTRYGAMHVTLVTSESSTSTDAHTGDRETNRSGIIAGVIIAIIIAAIIILAALYCYRNRDRISMPQGMPSVSLPTPTFFQRFNRNKEDQEINLELQRQPVVFDNRIFDGSLAGFENPTYGDLFAVETKAPLPPDYNVHYVPAKKPVSLQEQQETKPEESSEEIERDAAEGDLKVVHQPPRMAGETFGKFFRTPFQMVASKLRGSRSEEETIVPEEKVIASGKGDSGKRPKVKSVHSRDHQKLEEEDDATEKKQVEKVEKQSGFGNPLYAAEEQEEKPQVEKVEKRTEKKQVEKFEKQSGFGNPLYASEEQEVEDKDLGELGPSGYGGAEHTQKDSKRGGFENPLFVEESRERHDGSGSSPAPGYKVIGAIERDDESTA